VGGLGYVLADTLDYQPGEVIFEAGAGPDSTPYLAQRGPLVSAELREGRDAVAVLTDWGTDDRIKFAYLDSLDWPYANMNQGVLAQQRAEYAARGVTLSEDTSAAHHLELARLVAPLAAPGAVIAIDDTWADTAPTGVGFDGKGRDAIPWLLDQGWQLHAWHAEPWSGPDWSGSNRFYTAVHRS
jgi:hypothetical protein